MISHLLNYLLESSICLAVFYLFFRLLLWKEVFFVWNRMYILGALVLSLLIPVMEIPLQATNAAVLQGVFVIQLQEATVLSATASSVVNWQELLIWLYMGVSSILLLRLIFRISKLWYLSGTFRSSQATEYRLILTEGKLPTFSFFRLFFWDNSQEFSEEAKLQIFRHELTHIRQWHSADILFAEIIKVFFWFHPAVYLFKQSIQQVHEYLADAAVVQQHNTSGYIQLLVSQVLNTHSISISTPFHQPPIKNRIIMLQKFKQATPAFWKIALSLPIIATLVFLYSCQKNDVEESRPSSVTITSKSSKNTLTVEDILNKYRSRYPDIAVSEIHVHKNPDGSSGVRITVKNVSNLADKRKIEEEVSQTAQASLSDETFAVPSPGTLRNSYTGEIFQVVEEQPSPVGGYDAFYQYIGENIQYPQQARMKGIEGKVFVQFVVYNDGSIADVEVLKGIGAGCDAEAVKVIANAPKWTPGKQRGQPVNVRMSVPIAFKLN